MDTIHLVYGSDDNYWYPSAISAASAAWGCSRNLVIHLFDAGVTDEHYNDFVTIIHKANANVVCERNRLDKKMFEGFGAWKGSLVTYSRMFIADILPDVEWAIYVDGDTLWLGDIGELWDLRDETKLIQASIDPPTPMGTVNPEFTWYREHGLDVDASEYLCMGLMVANLKSMRESGIPAQCRDFMKRYPNPRVVDQTALNYVCSGKTVALPVNWGVFSTWHQDVDLTQPSLIHYVSDVPWKREKINKLFSDVVLIWFVFCKKVLGIDELARFSWWCRVWRRGLFVFLKHNQWVLHVHPFVKSRFRNTHGIAEKQYEQILKRFS